jgi:hypothetical protein
MIAESILIIASGAIFLVFIRVIGRSDTYIDIVTDHLARRRPRRELDRQRVASWARATSFFAEGVCWLIVALGIASLVVGLL